MLICNLSLQPGCWVLELYGALKNSVAMWAGKKWLVKNWSWFVRHAVHKVIEAVMQGRLPRHCDAETIYLTSSIASTFSCLLISGPRLGSKVVQPESEFLGDRWRLWCFSLSNSLYLKNKGASTAVWSARRECHPLALQERFPQSLHTSNKLLSVVFSTRCREHYLFFKDTFRLLVGWKTLCKWSDSYFASLA